VSYGCRPWFFFPGDVLEVSMLSFPQTQEYIVPSQTFKVPLQPKRELGLKLGNILNPIAILLYYKSD
jgi:hypothetical protein